MFEFECLYPGLPLNEHVFHHFVSRCNRGSTAHQNPKNVLAPTGTETLRFQKQPNNVSDSFSKPCCTVNRTKIPRWFKFLVSKAHNTIDTTSHQWSQLKMKRIHHHPTIQEEPTMLRIYLHPFIKTCKMCFLWMKPTMNTITLRRMIGIFAVCVLLWRIDIAAGIHDIAAFNDDNFTSSGTNTSLRGSRVLQNTLTTPKCDNIRTADYPAELQLFYTYSVEINDDLLLYDMERAIDNAVVMELDMCDVQGRPVYKVRTSTAHSFSTSSTY